MHRASSALELENPPNINMATNGLYENRGEGLKCLYFDILSGFHEYDLGNRDRSLGERARDIGSVTCRLYDSYILLEERRVSKALFLSA
jgi:hypothetical protein